VQNRRYTVPACGIAQYRPNVPITIEHMHEAPKLGPRVARCGHLLQPIAQRLNSDIQRGLHLGPHRSDSMRAGDGAADEQAEDENKNEGDNQSSAQR
jgi:hypothetical protein